MPQWADLVPVRLSRESIKPRGLDAINLLQSTLAVGVSMNETLMHIAQYGLPFGGVGPSGMRHHHGKFGFDTLSKLKRVFRQSRISGLGLFSPPYGAFFSRVIKFKPQAKSVKLSALFEPDPFDTFA